LVLEWQPSHCQRHISQLAVLKTDCITPLSHLGIGQQARHSLIQHPCHRSRQQDLVCIHSHRPFLPPSSSQCSRRFPLTVTVRCCRRRISLAPVTIGTGLQSMLRDDGANLLSCIAQFLYRLLTVGWFVCFDRVLGL
jgi:hypothetical protein